MAFDWIKWISNPFILMFITVITGLCLGRLLKIGTSGALFTGLAIGWGVVKLANHKISIGGASVNFYENMLKIRVVDKKFFLLFLILFVCSVGLLAADKIAIILKTYGAKFLVLGAVIVFTGAATTYAFAYFSKDSNPYEITGVYTGALTSSPGLAAAIETAHEHAEGEVDGFKNTSDIKKAKILKEIDSTGKLTIKNTTALTPEQKETYISKSEAAVGVGHAIGYPVGVMIVIFAMNFIPKIFGLDLNEEQLVFKKEMEEAEKKSSAKKIKPVTFDLLAFIFTCAIGYTVGMVKIYLGPLGYFSLGSTGGVLVTSIIFGHFGKLCYMNFRMDKKILGIIRDMALTFFLGIVGLRYGFAAIDSILGTGLYLCIISLAVGVFSMLVGFILGKYVFKINWIMLSGAICGGMTSTPGLGVAVDAIGSDDPAAGYAATYPFALFGMVLFTIILHKLPM
ncbi:MAG: hypothetical protein KAH04_03000 [Psychrilyobacter sp.]|nr:hypothetical protein [Psychrilyobacter sp.]